MFKILGGSTFPIFKFSTHIYNAVAKQWRKQCDNPLCKNPRLTMREFMWRGGRFTVYFLDGKPVIPFHDLSEYDKYLNTTTHFAMLGVSGVVNLGASFGAIPNLPTSGVGMRVEFKTENENYGLTSTRVDSLFSTVIVNTDYLGGQIATTQVAN